MAAANPTFRTNTTPCSGPLGEQSVERIGWPQIRRSRPSNGLLTRCNYRPIQYLRKYRNYPAPAPALQVLPECMPHIFSGPLRIQCMSFNASDAADNHCSVSIDEIRGFREKNRILPITDGPRDNHARPHKPLAFPPNRPPVAVTSPTDCWRRLTKPHA